MFFRFPGHPAVKRKRAVAVLVGMMNLTSMSSKNVIKRDYPKTPTTAQLGNLTEILTRKMKGL